MRKAASVLLATLVVVSCQTSFQPIEIDVSKRTPAAAVAERTPTPTPSPSAATPRPPVSSAQSGTTPAVSLPPTPAPLSTPGPQEVVDAQITAFNRHDLEAFLQTYAFDAVLYGHPDRVLQSGVEEIRVRYAQRFAESPELKAEILNRIVQGDFVIDQERVSGLPGGETLSAVVVYQVRGGKIQRVWFLR